MILPHGGRLGAASATDRFIGHNFNSRRVQKIPKFGEENKVSMQRHEVFILVAVEWLQQV
jgi:hypothetical protein